MSFAVAVMVATLIASSSAHALILGEVATQSMLGQPLRVVIPIQVADADDLQNGCSSVLPGTSPTADGMPTVTARVSVERAASGSRLVVTTAKPVNEPAVRLNVQSSCNVSL